MKCPKTILIASMLAMLSAPALAGDCVPFNEGQRLTLSGVASRWTGEGEHGIETDIMFKLDTPLCYHGGKTNPWSDIEIYPPPKGKFPRHMTVTGCVTEGEGVGIDVECKK